MNGMVLVPVAPNSSPSRITAMRGSSAWFYWKYNYTGDGRHPTGVKTKYMLQFVRYTRLSDGDVQQLAVRKGQNGSLITESTIHAPFTGRVQVIASNSTMVIHRLQYNDSLYEFSSTVDVRIYTTGTANIVRTIALEPKIRILVNGRGRVLILNLL